MARHCEERSDETLSSKHPVIARSEATKQSPNPAATLPKSRSSISVSNFQSQAGPLINVHLIAAARPNFMKVAPLYHALKKTECDSCTVNEIAGKKNGRTKTTPYIWTGHLATLEESGPGSSALPVVAGEESQFFMVEQYSPAATVTNSPMKANEKRPTIEPPAVLTRSEIS